jgi:hypothetical protein
MYLPYEILRNLGPENRTAARQRAEDDQLGRLAAGLMRRSRSRPVAVACPGGGPGLRGQDSGPVSKSGRDAARRRSGIVRPAA